MGLKIDELAERGGVTRRTVRYYVSSGLLPAPGSGAAYGQEHLDALTAIKRLQSEGLSLRAIGERLAGSAPAAGASPLVPAVEAPDAELPASDSAEPIGVANLSIAEPDPRESAAAELHHLRMAFAAPRQTREPGVWRAAERLVALVALGVAVGALVVAAFALAEAKDSPATVPPTAGVAATATTAPPLPAACAFATKRANDLGTLAANLFGPDAARPLTPAEAQELQRQVDESLTLRERACVER